MLYYSRSYECEWVWHLPLTIFFTYNANVTLIIIELYSERVGGISLFFFLWINKQYTFTMSIRTIIDNINVSKIKTNEMEFIIILTMWTIVKIAEKLAKIEEKW